jgi:Holliday junction resolvase RusA-like endonuclease
MDALLPDTALFLNMIKFTVPAKIVGKERPRYSSQSRSFFTPKKTKEFEALVSAYAKNHMVSNSRSIIDVACTVIITIRIAVPNSYSKKKREQALTGGLFPTTTPDIDNCAKSLLDGMNGVTFTDDKLVTSLIIRKVYDQKNSVEIVVYSNDSSSELQDKIRNSGIK